jgi:hypothetical protein
MKHQNKMYERFTDNLLLSILINKNIFQNVLDWISYDDMIALSIVNRSISDFYRQWLEESYIAQAIRDKFECRKSRLFVLDQDQHLGLTYLLMNDKNIYLLPKYYFRELFIHNNLQNGDVIDSNGNKYILHNFNAYSTVYCDQIYIPKNIQQKYNLNRWKFLGHVNAYITVDFDDFDFEQMEIISRGGIEYGKLWNKRLKVHIWMYATHYTFDKNKSAYIEVFKKTLRNAIEHVDKWQYVPLDAPFFYANHDVKASQFFISDTTKAWYIGP